MTQKDIDTALKLIDLLVDFGIPAAQALYRTIKAMYGRELTEEEMADLLLKLAQDAHVRGLLAKADAAGNG